MSRPKTRIGLVQIGELNWERRPSKQFHLVDGALRPKASPTNNRAASLAYLPHSVALLQSYAKAHARDPESFEFVLPLYKRIPVSDAVEHLSQCDIVGFSIYVWNVRYSLAVARELKRVRPHIILLMGGPQVPDHAENFLRDNPFVDFVCHGEGEKTFLDGIESRDGQAWRNVRSVSYLDTDGRYVANPLRPRMTGLDEVPSPMLDGTYERLMQSAPQQEWLATWETNRGCPFACAFCDWGSATGSKVSRYGEDRLGREIEWMVDHHIHHLCVCDANFGMLPRDVEIARRIAEAYSRRQSPLAISIQNTKNRTDRSEQIQRIFRDSRVVSFGASISLQSVDPTVLKAIKRDNISLEAFDRLQKHYAEQGLDTYSDLIIGLPGESYDSFSNGIARVIRSGQINRVAFYECYVLPNAAMSQPEYRAQFKLETVPIRMTHFHEPLDRNIGEEPEFIDMVTSTSTMDRTDWVRARVLAYLVELLFYDRLLHVPIVLLGAAIGLDYRQMFEAFAEAGDSRFPIIASTRRILESHARAMMEGGSPYIASREWLNLYWPADQYALISLMRNGQIDAFYAEARCVLTERAALSGFDDIGILVENSVRLNQAMFARPFELTDEIINTSYPVARAYHDVLSGRQADLAPEPSACRVERTGTIWMSWTDWCEDLIRRLFLRKNYLYPVTILDGAAPVSLVPDTVEMAPPRRWRVGNRVGAEAKL